MSDFTAPAARPAVPAACLAAGTILLCAAALLPGSLASWTARLCLALAGSVACAAAFLLTASMLKNLRSSLAECAQALAESRASSDAFRQALEQSPVPLLAFDGSGKLLLASGSYKALTGVDASTRAGASLADVAGGEIAAAVDKAAYPEGVTVRVASSGGQELRSRVIAAQSPMGLLCHFIPLASQRRNLEASEKRRLVILETAKRLGGLASELDASARRFEEGAAHQVEEARRQKRNTDSVAAAMEEMAASVSEVARNTQVTWEEARQTGQTATEGSSLVDGTAKGIDELSRSASGLSRDLEALSRQAGEIGRIIGVINDIADQTNLLALNAAIEAARAGESGRGFAVVADEVRKLAEKTLTATKDVRTAVETIRAASADAVASMNGTSAQVETARELSSATAQALERIRQDASRVADHTAEIASAAGQQSQTASEIARNVEDVDRIAESFVEASERQGEAASRLRGLSGELQELARVLGEGPPGA